MSSMVEYALYELNKVTWRPCVGTEICAHAV